MAEEYDDTRKGYNGNPLLKKPRNKMVWVKERMEEYAKCKFDPIYFAEKYVQIVHVDHGLIPLVLYDYQKEIIDKITNNRLCTVVTSRQAGKCVDINTIVKIRNKKTGEIQDITIGELYELEAKKRDKNVDIKKVIQLNTQIS